MQAIGKNNSFFFLNPVTTVQIELYWTELRNNYLAWIHLSFQNMC